ncbi:helix-turn-helix transcriptional regulator [Bacteriovorax sp. Seq25_V]|uniref:helix-turn-helix transcriptional regulator n=1 Tax=Bacteriovorax sp. Seq25_V TaxID=1201288 RepID=UPI000389EA02|nr:helix-turn-helix transcriptional regulator [Bacteriovorax sp. Seq25_V]EQC43787.1 sigma-70, region 4 [Bacteriovorax sp. Seq25_V]
MIIKDMIESLQKDVNSYMRIESASIQNLRAAIYDLGSKINELASLCNEISVSTSSPLTPKEQEVLSYVAGGFTNKEIASAMRISPKTIEYHLTSLFKKTESTNRTECLANALKNRWL